MADSSDRRLKIPAVPDGVTVYAVGDVHGRSDLLCDLLDRLRREPRAPGAPPPTLVFVGDYVDRGPDSRGVIDAVLTISPREFTVVPLMGNHDWAMLTFLTHPEMGPDWVKFGGDQTLASYGVDLPTRGKPNWNRISQALAEQLPPAHAAFLTRLQLSYSVGDYFFCHAGARPNQPLTAQTERDLLWIRDPFLGAVEPFEKVVVHGHTVEPAVYSDHRRIGLDTGAYLTGVLSVVRLQGRTRAFLAADDRDTAERAAQAEAADVRIRRAADALDRELEALTARMAHLPGLS